MTIEQPPIAFANYDALHRYLLKNKTKKKSISFKHLPGKHNQRSHGRRGYGSSRGTGMSAQQFVDESTRIGNEVQRIIDNEPTRTRIIYTDEERQKFLEATVPGYVDEKNFGPNPNLYYTAKGYMDGKAFNGFTLDEALRSYHVDQYFQGISDEDHLRWIAAQDAHHERAVAVSRMSYSEQNKAFDILQQRIRDTKDIRNPDGSWNQQVVSDYEAVFALAIYGNPDVRMRAIKLADEEFNPDVARQQRSTQNGNISYRPIEFVYGQSSIRDSISYYSLDHRLYETQKKYDRNDTVQQGRFMQRFTYTHANETTTNVLGAAIQHAVFQVGPNTSGKHKSLYPKGVIPPETHPTILRYLKEQHQITQDYFASKGITEVELYRGTRFGKFDTGIPMAPYSTSYNVAKKFAYDTGGKGGLIQPRINKVKLPVKYILMMHAQKNFETIYTSEDEYLVLGSGMHANVVSYSDSVQNNIDTREFTVKSLSPFASANGEVDYSILSLYEPEYDIFYNYRSDSIKTKKKSIRFKSASLGENISQTSSEISIRFKNKRNAEIFAEIMLKHGKHDQKTHGRRGKRGGGKMSAVSINGMTADQYIADFNTAVQTYFNDYAWKSDGQPILEKLHSEISQLDEQQQMALLNSPNINDDILFALTQYGKPAVRERGAQMLVRFGHTPSTPINGRWDDVYITPYTQTYTRQDGTSQQTSLFRHVMSAHPAEYITLSSMEGLHRQLKLKHPDYSDEKLNDLFVEVTFLRHAYAGIPQYHAQFQTTMSKVGPNATVPITSLPPVFFGQGIKPIEPNPRFVGIFNNEYQRVQSELASRGITEVTLYRSSAYKPGLPLEPWTPLKRIANKFETMYTKKTGQRIVRREGKIPAKYFLGRWDITRGWPEAEVVGKEEHMVAGIAYAYDTGVLP